MPPRRAGRLVLLRVLAAPLVLARISHRSSLRGLLSGDRPAQRPLYRL